MCEIRVEHGYDGLPYKIELTNKQVKTQIFKLPHGNGNFKYSVAIINKESESFLLSPKEDTDYQKYNYKQAQNLQKKINEEIKICQKLRIGSSLNKIN